MPISSDTMIALRKGLVAAASLLAERAKAKANSQNVPKVSEHMKVGKVETKGSGALGITISIGMKENEAPAAAAYEFGSGLYGKEGKKYRIPKEGSDKILAIPAERTFFLKRFGQSLIPVAAEGLLFFPHVMHPGVGARPYMKPAIEENKEEMKRLIGEFFTIDVVHKAIREAWYA